MPPVRRPPRSAPVTERCRYVARSGARCSRVATIEGSLCRRHAELLARELEDGALNTIDSVISGRVSIGDVISGAAQSYLERLFGGNPVLRDLDQAARQAAAQAQARRAAHPPPPPPGPGSRPGSPPPRSPSPRPDPAIRAREILGFEASEPLSKERIEDRRRQLAKVFHPDRQGGSTAQMQRVNQAADLLLSRLKPPVAKPR